jgi:hypothetical protein
VARVSIREYEHIAAIANGNVPVGVEPALATSGALVPGASQRYALQGGERVRFVRVATDVSISLDFGGNAVTASAGECDMAAGQTEYFGIGPSVTHVAYVAT